MTTLAVRVPEETMQSLDALVVAGQYPNRTAAVRAALDALLDAEHRRAVDRAIVEGYRRHPPAPPDEFLESLADRSVMDEPW